MTCVRAPMTKPNIRNLLAFRSPVKKPAMSSPGSSKRCRAHCSNIADTDPVSMRYTPSRDSVSIVEATQTIGEQRKTTLLLLGSPRTLPESKNIVLLAIPTTVQKAVNFPNWSESPMSEASRPRPSVLGYGQFSSTLLRVVF